MPWVVPFRINLFYESNEVKQVLQLLTVSFLLFPFGAITLAYLRRTLNFGARFKVEVSVSLVKASTAISCAMYGLSYMSLAWASIAEAIATILMVMVVRPKGLPYLPGLRSLKHVFSTSWKLAGGGFLIFIWNAAPALIVGKVLGFQAVGLLDRGLATINIFNHLLSKSVDTVVLPYFSSSKRAGSTLKNEYLKSTCIITGIAWPFFIFLSFNAELLITLLYGNTWTDIAPIVVSLSVARMLFFSCYLYEQWIVAQGRSKDFLRLQGLLTPIGVILIILTSPYGLLTASYSFVILAVLRLAVVTYSLNSVDHISPLNLIRSIQPSIYIALAITGGCWGLYLIEPCLNLHPVIYLAIKTALLVSVWLACVFIFRHPLTSEIVNLFQHTRLYISRKKL